MGSRLFIDLTSPSRNTMGLGLFFKLMSPGGKIGSRLSRPLGGTAVGLAPEGGLVGHPPDWPPAQTKMGSPSAWARFLMGLGNRRHERRSRHLGVVGMAVDCAPGGGLVGRLPTGMPAQKMGSASAWARFLMGLGKQRRERRSRHLGVVGMAVGCAPGWGIVRHPLGGTPCRHNAGGRTNPLC